MELLVKDVSGVSQESAPEPFRWVPYSQKKGVKQGVGGSSTFSKGRLFKKHVRERQNIAASGVESKEVRDRYAGLRAIEHRDLALIKGYLNSEVPLQKAVWLKAFSKRSLSHAFFSVGLH